MIAWDHEPAGACVVLAGLDEYQLDASNTIYELNKKKPPSVKLCNFIFRLRWVNDSFYKGYLFDL